MMIGYTVPEIRRLLAALTVRLHQDKHVWWWSRWRRRRQLQARLSHYQSCGYRPDMGRWRPRDDLRPSDGRRSRSRRYMRYRYVFAVAPAGIPPGEDARADAEPGGTR